MRVWGESKSAEEAQPLTLQRGARRSSAAFLTGKTLPCLHQPGVSSPSMRSLAIGRGFLTLPTWLRQSTCGVSSTSLAASVKTGAPSAQVDVAWTSGISPPGRIVLFG